MKFRFITDCKGLGVDCMLVLDKVSVTFSKSNNDVKLGYYLEEQRDCSAEAPNIEFCYEKKKFVTIELWGPELPLNGVEASKMAYDHFGDKSKIHKDDPVIWGPKQRDIMLELSFALGYFTPKMVLVEDTACGIDAGLNDGLIYSNYICDEYPEGGSMDDEVYENVKANALECCMDYNELEVNKRFE